MHESKCYKLLLVAKWPRYIKEPNLIPSVTFERRGGESDEIKVSNGSRTRVAEVQMIGLGLLA